MPYSLVPFHPESKRETTSPFSISPGPVPIKISGNACIQNANTYSTMKQRQRRETAMVARLTACCRCCFLCKESDRGGTQLTCEEQTTHPQHFPAILWFGENSRGYSRRVRDHGGVSITTPGDEKRTTYSASGAAAAQQEATATMAMNTFANSNTQPRSFRMYRQDHQDPSSPPT